MFFSVQGGEDEEGLGGDQHSAGVHCPQPQEETPGWLILVELKLNNIQISNEPTCCRMPYLRCRNKSTNLES